MPDAPPFPNSTVSAAFDAFTSGNRDRLLKLRELIFEIAASKPRVGPLLETVKWGQPSYVPQKARVGSPIRLGISPKGDTALFAHCQTKLVSEFKSLFPDDFNYDGHRAVYVPASSPIPRDQIGLLIGNALTYHLKDKV